VSGATYDSFAAAWEAEGRRISPELRGIGSAVIVGRDAEAAAWVALGLARAQSAERRVAVGDLVGDLPPFMALLQGDDPHGLSDSFRFGVSLNKIARQADGAGNLFILPSGSEPVAVEDILRSHRWRRLAGGFGEVGALLLLVAHADAPGLDALVASTDGVIAAGDIAGALPDTATPLAVVGPRPRRPRSSPPPEPAVPAPAVEATPAPAVLVETAPAPRPAPPRGTLAPPRRSSWVRWLAIAVFALVTAGALLFFFSPITFSKLNDQTPPPLPDSLGTTIDTSRGSMLPDDSVVAPASGASALGVSGVPVGDSLVPTEPMNPSDSASAAAYAVYIVAANSPEGATLDQHAPIDELPAATVTPVVYDRDTSIHWYRLTVGAFPRAAQAESLLRALRRQGVLNASTASGNVVRMPYALLVEDRVLASQAPRRVVQLKARGAPVYPLSRGDGTVGLYAGAFEEPEESALLLAQLRRAGLRPLLVYRTGRGM
jgi:cell division septation protein DedD